MPSHTVRSTAACLMLLTLLFESRSPICGQAVAPADVPALADEADRKGNSGKWSEALPLWEKIVKANPVVADFWQGLARARFNTGDFRGSIPAYERALDLRAGYPFNSVYDIGCAYARMGEKDRAIHSLERAFDMGFRDVEHARTDSDLRSLRDDVRFKDLVGIVDTSAMSRAEGWRYDLKFLVRELKRLHYDLRRLPRPDFDSAVKRLYDEIPNLTDNQATVRLQQIARMAGDGHTGIRPAHRTGAPIQLYLCQEGLFITAAAPGHEDLLGAQVLKIGGHSPDEALNAVSTIVPQDNAMGLKSIGPNVLRMPSALNGLGLISKDDKLPLTIRDLQGKTREVELPTGAGQPDSSWTLLSKTVPGSMPLYLKDRASPYWFEYIPDQKLVYFQYNAVRNAPGESLEPFCTRLFKRIEEKDVERLVLDMRWNGGGNTFLNKPIVHGIIKCEKINQRGKLFVIIGRQTFSAAQNCITSLERNTNAIFVGEPSGSSPNFVGETIRITLPYSKMQGSISDLYWQSSWPMDYRTWIAPQIYAPPTFAANAANRDPALEAILGYKEPVHIAAAQEKTQASAK